MCSPQHVTFRDSPISEIVTYEKYTRFEIMNLFYSHDDAMKFQYDFERESLAAAKAGKAWTDWCSELVFLPLPHTSSMLTHTNVRLYVNANISLTDIGYDCVG